MKPLDDVAWFYSSLAQASAAIVGLMGAILGSRLVTYRTAITAARERIIRRSWDTERLLRRLRHETAIAIAPETARIVPSFKGPVHETQIFAAAAEWRRLYQELPGGPRAHHDDGIQGLNLFAHEVAHFKASVVPWRFIPEMAVLAWLAGCGVIWPLSALPGFGEGAYPKTWMLSAFALGMVGLFVYYFVQLFEIRSLRVLEWPAEEDVLG